MIQAFDPRCVVDAISRVVGGPAALHEPRFVGREWDYVKECIDTGWISTAGKFVERFEDMLVEQTGVGHAIAVVNGTAALHSCLMLVGVGQDDEVVIPALTFAATAAAVAYCGAIPHFADSCPNTLGLDPAKLDAWLSDVGRRQDGKLVNRLTERRIAAVVCMHTYGHPVDLDALVEVCNRHGLPLVEDAAESLGTTYKGRHTGNYGVVSAVSFNGNKIVTTGGGGVILTNDPDLARRAKHLTTTAKLPHRWEFSHDMVGYNYRMPNINAALGCAQLERLPEIVEAKRLLAARYDQAFAGLGGVRFFTEPGFARSNYWLNVILLDRAQADKRDTLLEMLNDAGYMSRPAWVLMSRLPPYAEGPRMDVSVAEDIYDRLINIPSSPFLVDPR
ncbi:LegC family aminotransferase [Magnetospirillum gryphiswaldense]|uniref:LegC family aminotransferase n=1 Tax=Magnetospirillum gryphiswaldense TaxID=55518 RepID=UPI0005A0F94D|nr:LegC family aminotransferase [Magnetospirillum gryphiswaldense]